MSDSTFIRGRLLVLGATGGTGRSVVEQAAAAGYLATALVRNRAKAPPASRVVVGDLLRDASVLDSAVAGQDAVISTLGVGSSLTSGNLITASAPAIVSAMRAHAVRRLIFLSALGLGGTWRDTPLLARLVIKLLLRDIYADHDRGERIISASDLEWTIVYPVGLTNGPHTGRYRAGERLSLRGVPLISRADVADFLVSEIRDRSWVHKHVLLARA